MEKLLIDNQETYVFNAREFTLLKEILRTLQSWQYLYCYKHSRITRNEFQAVISQLGRLVYD